jgi:hypothetical protein
MSPPGNVGNAFSVKHLKHRFGYELLVCSIHNMEFCSLFDEIEKWTTQRENAGTRYFCIYDIRHSSTVTIPAMKCMLRIKSFSEYMKQCNNLLFTFVLTDTAYHSMIDTLMSFLSSPSKPVILKENQSDALEYIDTYVQTFRDSL